MKRTMGFLCLGTVMVIASVALADSNTYTPPPQVGDVYTVIKFKWGGIGTTEDTKVSATWGSWSKSRTIPVIKVPQHCGISRNAGFVLKLHHRKADKVPLTISTDGTIARPPMQGSPPPEWGKACYRQVSW
ncbi:MAG: hypothetical protein MUF54_08110 [Polyangiaceae bacterium]|jgi:hypothetical protein|nr:hypothetical protein [Polyangiaceae bacterium]